ncbi:response regulator transcription factor [Sediminibacterium roseum]|uniref:Response regulator transcription factor n=1 Tax=Sediminibacterium roseum TaxID=1978412 RepID=A0ABW9ZSY2_9BACT|nr:response regulator transcription factor [Sediminibacterium roseum]NCI49537.1 response regulator transcription factor [Sediminibacterium roseum]
MRILIADDHTIVREGIKMLLRDAYPNAEIVDVCDSIDLMKCVYKQKWDVIICDISMPPGDSGLDAIKQIKENSPKTPVIILSMHKPDQYAVRAIKAGAMGYINKGAATLELVKAVNQVMSGRKYLSDDVADVLADAFEHYNNATGVETLTDREFEVFKLIASGRSISEIAKQLVLSNNTVSSFRTRVFEKMGFQNNLELIRYAVDNKLI